MAHQEEHAGLMSGGLPLGLLVAIGAGLMLLGATFILALEASREDAARRIRGLVRPSVGARPAQARRRQFGLAGVVGRLGEVLRDSAFLSQRSIEELERLVQAAGYSPRSGVPTIIGAKILLLLLCPLLALAFGAARGYAPPAVIILAAAGATFGVLLPNWVLK